MYQKLKESEKVKDDCIHIAAHELRTPIQPILGLADILCSKQTGGGQERINQVISNLLSNAIKFTNKGTISITAAAVPNNNEIVVTYLDYLPNLQQNLLRVPDLVSSYQKT